MTPLQLETAEYILIADMEIYLKTILDEIIANKQNRLVLNLKNLKILKNNKNAKAIGPGLAVGLIKPPPDPQLHLTHLRHEERHTSFHYHFHKSI